MVARAGAFLHAYSSSFCCVGFEYDGECVGAGPDAGDAEGEARGEGTGDYSRSVRGDYAGDGDVSEGGYGC